MQYRKAVCGRPQKIYTHISWMQSDYGYTSAWKISWQDAIVILGVACA